MILFLFGAICQLFYLNHTKQRAKMSNSKMCATCLSNLQIDTSDQWNRLNWILIFKNKICTRHDQVSFITIQHHHSFVRSIANNLIYVCCISWRKAKKPNSQIDQRLWTSQAKQAKERERMRLAMRQASAPRTKLTSACMAKQAKKARERRAETNQHFKLL